MQELFLGPLYTWSACRLHWGCDELSPTRPLHIVSIVQCHSALASAFRGTSNRSANDDRIFFCSNLTAAVPVLYTISLCPLCIVLVNILHLELFKPSRPLCLDLYRTKGELQPQFHTAHPWLLVGQSLPNIISPSFCQQRVRLNPLLLVALVNLHGNPSSPCRGLVVR